VGGKPDHQAIAGRKLTRDQSPSDKPFRRAIPREFPAIRVDGPRDPWAAPSIPTINEGIAETPRFARPRSTPEHSFRTVELFPRAPEAIGARGLESDEDKAAAAGGNQLNELLILNRFRVI
jgi:hypothetical protein